MPSIQSTSINHLTPPQYTTPPLQKIDATNEVFIHLQEMFQYTDFQSAETLYKLFTARKSSDYDLSYELSIDCSRCINRFFNRDIQKILYNILDFGLCIDEENKRDKTCYTAILNLTSLPSKQLSTSLDKLSISANEIKSYVERASTLLENEEYQKAKETLEKIPTTYDKKSAYEISGINLIRTGKKSNIPWAMLFLESYTYLEKSKHIDYRTTTELIWAGHFEEAAIWVNRQGDKWTRDSLRIYAISELIEQSNFEKAKDWIEEMETFDMQAKYRNKLKEACNKDC